MTMGVHRLNHAVLYVRDVETSTAFYGSVLDFRVVSQFPGAAFLQAPDSTNDHDLGLFQIGSSAGASDAGRSTVGLYHLAWEVDTLGELQRIAGVLREEGSLVGASDHGTTKSLYARDPDGIEFEVVWIIPAHLLTADDLAARASVSPLDLPAEIERFGRDEPGGIGISTPSGTNGSDPSVSSPTHAKAT
jgi:catechol-2,3-dioxygenase